MRRSRVRHARIGAGRAVAPFVLYNSAGSVNAIIDIEGWFQ
jgi:hypothetical protein